MQLLQTRVQGLQAASSDSLSKSQLQFLLEVVAPNLTEFFNACSHTSLRALMDNSCLATAQGVAEGLLAVARQHDGLTQVQAEQMDDFRQAMSHVLGGVDLSDEPFEAKQGRAESARSQDWDPANNTPLWALHLVQTQCRAQFPENTLDGVEEFDERLLGIDEDGALDEVLLEKLMGQITDGSFSAKVKVCVVLEPGAYFARVAFSGATAVQSTACFPGADRSRHCKEPDSTHRPYNNHRLQEFSVPTG